jgi:hypothetical protein
MIHDKEQWNGSQVQELSLVPFAITPGSVVWSIITIDPPKNVPRAKLGHTRLDVYAKNHIASSIISLSTRIEIVISPCVDNESETATSPCSNTETKATTSQYVDYGSSIGPNHQDCPYHRPDATCETQPFARPHCQQL